MLRHEWGTRDPAERRVIPGLKSETWGTQIVVGLAKIAWSDFEDDGDDHGAASGGFLD